jgi:putative hydrolase of the HAD superfamily
MAGHAQLAALNRCFISSGVGFRKPSPQFFHAVQTQLGLPPGAILMVGDDYENDLVAARACGWQAVLVNRSGKPSPEYGVNAISDLRFLI